MRLPLAVLAPLILVACSAQDLDVGDHPDGAVAGLDANFDAGMDANVDANMDANVDGGGASADAPEYPPLDQPPTGPGVVAFATAAGLQALLVGQWIRVLGAPELQYETVGLEFTSDGYLFALQDAPADAGLERVLPDQLGVKSWTILSTDAGLEIQFVSSETPSTLTIGAPSFVDQGQVMWLDYEPWAADYLRVSPATDH